MGGAKGGGAEMGGAEMGGNQLKQILFLQKGISQTGKPGVKKKQVTFVAGCKMKNILAVR